MKKISCWYWYSIVLFLMIIPLYPKEEIIQLKRGNLALPSSQQPGPLLGFGQNVIDKHDRQVLTSFLLTHGKNKSSVGLVPSFLYGITNHASVICSLPITTQTFGPDQSNGVGDLFLQAEYQIFAQKKERLTNEATLVASLILPTGSGSKNPSTGFGSPACFLGATLNRTEIDWYLFASPGVIITTTNNDKKAGNQYIVQCGVGRNIPSPSGTIILGMVELNGLFVQDSKMQGVSVVDTSAVSASLSLCPSLWFSSEKIIVQGGIAIPLFQHVRDGQTKNDYILVTTFGLKF